MQSCGLVLSIAPIIYATFNLIICTAQVNIGGYQILKSACGQDVIYVNGQYRLACANGYLDDYNKCIEFIVPKCPQGYVFWQGFCHQQQHSPTQQCPTGEYLNNGICYPTAPPPCATEVTTVSNTTPLPDPGAEPDLALPAPDYSIRCPPDSVLMQDRCRKIICPIGEYYEGRCLQPTCPEGTVWRGRRCQPPGYVTTILEIENVFVNKAQNRRGQILQTNEINIQTPKPMALDSATRTAMIHPTRSSRLKESTTTSFAIPTTKFTTPQPRRENGRGKCCKIYTPRICKIYGTKWICFNKRIVQCDAQICTHPTMYLRIEEVSFNPPILVMPPNPPLKVCAQPNCDDTETIDCSGCPHNRRETCSRQCYYNQCPHGECDYVDLREYCLLYPGGFGCTKSDGCIWDWCGRKEEICK